MGILLTTIFVLGLCFGSFVNMLVYRAAIKDKLESRKFRVESERRSFCDYCGKKLDWDENIPVVSWLIQEGKTKCCHKRLPVLYPVVEVITGVLFLLSFQFLIHNFELINLQTIIEVFIIYLIIVSLVFSAVFDFKYMILPNTSTVILTAGALVLWYFGYLGSWGYFLSAILSFGFLGFLYLITKKEGMGFGDVKLAFFMGLLLGYPKIIVAFYVAFVVGAVASLILIILKKAGRKTLIPFGPFLILGTFVAWWYGDYVLGLSIFQFIR